MSKYLPFFFLLLLFSCQDQNANQVSIAFLDAFEDETIAQANEGFFDALAEAGFSEKENTLRVIYRNAQGDIPTLVQALDYIISQEPALIATNPTISTITAVQKTKEFPVCMMVCSHPRLIGLLDQEGQSPDNLFGVYDELDYIATSVEIIRELLPEAKKVGVIYNQAEPQSLNSLKVIEEQCNQMGLVLKALPVNNSSETQLVVESLVNEKVDAFFAMPDNVVFASFEVIFKVCDQAGIPVFTSEEGLVKRGSMAAYGADMYQWGYQAGQQAAFRLKYPGQKLPELEKVKIHKKIINPLIAEKFGIKADSSFTSLQLSTPDKEKIMEEVSTEKTYNNFYLSALLLGLGFAGLGLGIFISMRIFEIPDITTDGSYTLGAAVAASLLIQDFPLLLVVPMVLLAGGLAGICTGFIHTKLKVNALLAGILVMTALYSVNLMIMGKSNIPLLDSANILSLLKPYFGQVFSEFFMLSLIGLFLALFIIFLLRTDFGLAMRATGNSESMVRANGVNTDRMKIIGLAISNALVALSGFLIVQYQGFADINMGIGIVIIGLGSVMIGETISKGLGQSQIHARIFGVIIGTILFRLILAVTLAIGIDPNLLRLITATIVLVVVSLPNLKISNN